MNVMAVDQARHGAWSIYEYETKTLLSYGTFNFESKDYTYAEAILQIELLVNEVIHANDVDVVFFEDIQMRQNKQVFKKLAQLQGVLVNLCEKNKYRYGIIASSQWQNYCGARGRTEAERKKKLDSLDPDVEKTTKELSIQAVKKYYDIETQNDNLADAIMMGHYVVNKIKI